MRSTLVLLLCISGLTAGEAPVVIPALELSFGGGAPPLAAPVDGWWKQSLSEAAAWWSERTGKPVTAADAACTSLRFVAGTVALPNGRRRIAVAGRWEGATPALAESVRAIIGRWPGRTIRVVGSTLHMDCEGLTVDSSPPPMGWRMVVRGEGLMAELGPEIARRERNKTLNALLKVFGKSIDLIATVDGQGQGSATLTNPSLCKAFSQPDTAILGRLPEDAAFVGAIGLDGEKALALLPGIPWNQMQRDWQSSRDDFAAALTGTWGVVFHDEDHWMTIIPISPVMNKLMAIAEKERQNPSNKIPTTEVWRQWILVTTAPELIAQWKNRAARMEVGPNAVSLTHPPWNLHKICIDNALRGGRRLSWLLLFVPMWQPLNMRRFASSTTFRRGISANGLPVHAKRCSVC